MSMPSLPLACRAYSAPPPSEKVQGIVDSIAGLTLLETAELIGALKVGIVAG